MRIPKIRHDFKKIIKETPKAILFSGFDGKDYWIPKKLCTLIKQKKDRIVATLAVFKFEEITHIKAEPLDTNFPTLGNEILTHHEAENCQIVESREYPLLSKQRELVKKHINSRFTAWLCEAGTGKTICTITIAYSRWKSGLISHTFVLVPASLQKQWHELIKEYYNDFNAFTICSIHSTSMEQSLEKVYDKFKKNKGDVQLIIDESHLMRNQTAKRSRNIEKLFKAKYVQIATAFPIERNAGDLFFQFGVMNREIIGEKNYGAFQSKFLLLGGADGEQVVAYQNTAELNKRINPYIARMRLSEVHGSLPKIEYKNVYFSLNNAQKEAYKAIEDLLLRLQDKNNWIPANKRYMLNTFLLKLSSGYVPTSEEINGIFKDLGKLGESADNIRKIAGVGYDDNNNRIKALMKILKETDNEQTIIWCSFVDEIKTIHSQLPNSQAIYGEVDIPTRNRILEDFNTKKTKHLVISIAINEGFNLQNCKNAILFSDNYSRTKRENAIKRIHRIGQTKQCYVYRLLAENSLDIRIREVGKRKDKICNIFDNE